MNRIAVVGCVLLLAVVACSAPAAYDSPPASPLRADATGCSPLSGSLRQTLGDINLYFYCGITDDQRELITEYVGHALEAVPAGLALKADVYVLSDPQQAAGVRFGWLLAHGYPQPYQDVLHHVGAECGEAERGVLFFYLTDECWYSSSAYPNAELVLHEMHHLIQLEISGPAPYGVPVWLEEGAADFFAWKQLNALNASSFREPAPSPACNYRLTDLEVWSDPARTVCVYWEGQQAAGWLIEAYGVDTYYGVLQHTASASFDTRFAETYGISTANFYRLFDQYRKSGYSVLPALPASAP